MGTLIPTAEAISQGKQREGKGDFEDCKENGCLGEGESVSWRKGFEVYNRYL